MKNIVWGFLGGISAAGLIAIACTLWTGSPAIIAREDLVVPMVMLLIWMGYKLGQATWQGADE